MISGRKETVLKVVAVNNYLVHEKSEVFLKIEFVGSDEVVKIMESSNFALIEQTILVRRTIISTMTSKLLINIANLKEFVQTSSKKTELARFEVEIAIRAVTVAQKDWRGNAVTEATGSIATGNTYVRWMQCDDHLAESNGKPPKVLWLVKSLTLAVLNQR